LLLDPSKLEEQEGLARSCSGGELLPQVYDKLRGLAYSLLKKYQPGRTLQATALVHEAFLRVVGDQDPGWDSRRHFFGSAANAMRNILVEQSRRNATEKHGGKLERIELHDDLALELPEADHLLALHDSLERLQKAEPRLAEVVILRYFAGMTMQEIADTLGESERTVYRYWRRSRAWLGRDLDATLEWHARPEGDWQR
jgi:RNA polymerase sigma factor (TIGR02999 family)